jgi:hypothetical protein
MLGLAINGRAYDPLEDTNGEKLANLPVQQSTKN